MRKVTSGKIDLTKRWVAHTQRSQIHWPVWKVIWLSQKLWPFPRLSGSGSYAMVTFFPSFTVVTLNSPW